MHDGRLRTPAGAIGNGEGGGRRVRETSSRDRGGGDGDGEDAGVSAAGDLQRAARGDLDGDEIAAGAAGSKGRAGPAETFCAESEVCGDEGAGQCFVSDETPCAGGPAHVARDGGGGRVPADSGLVEADGD